MNLTSYKNEDALELLVDLIEPVGNLFVDKDFVSAIQSDKKIEAVKIAVKNHKSDIIFVLARLNGQKPEEYNGNIITMTAQLLEILNDQELIDFFTSQGLTKVGES